MSLNVKAVLTRKQNTTDSINPKQPKVCGVKFNLREIKRIIFPLKYLI